MGKMILQLENIWDFHIDPQQVQHPPVVNDYLLEQIDLPTAAHLDLPSTDTSIEYWGAQSDAQRCGLTLTHEKAKYLELLILDQGPRSTSY